MNIQIYHNPRCSKSRATLELLQTYCAANDTEVEVIAYLETPPSAARLAELVEMLGLSPHALLRHKEAPYKELSLTAQTPATALYAAMVEHPILIERPIVVVRDGSGQERATIGRPPENVHDLLP